VVRRKERENTAVAKDPTDRCRTRGPVAVENDRVRSRLGVVSLSARCSFDRLIIAQAMVEGIALASGDTAFGAYPVTRLW
jgi:hypothetical protein